MVIMPILNLKKYTKEQQVSKIIEECKEVNEAVKENNKEHILEECFDVIQSVVGLMSKIANHKEIREAGAKNYVKLRDRDWKLEGLIKIKRQE